MAVIHYNHAKTMELLLVYKILNLDKYFATKVMIQLQ